LRTIEKGFRTGVDGNVWKEYPHGRDTGEKGRVVWILKGATKRGKV